MKYEDFKMPVTKTENILDDIVRYNKKFITMKCGEFNDMDKSCDRLKEKKEGYELFASLPILLIGMTYIVCWLLTTGNYTAEIGTLDWKLIQFAIKIHQIPIKNWLLVSSPFLLMAFISICYGSAVKYYEGKLYDYKEDLKDSYEATGLKFPGYFYGWLHNNWDKMTSDQYVEKAEYHDEYTRNGVINRVDENFPYISKMQELENLSNDYEYMCAEKTDKSITFYAFENGQKIDDKSFTIDVDPKYQDKASRGDFTFIDDVWNDIRYKILM